MKNKVTAKYNMTFDNGHFSRNKEYFFKKHNNESYYVFSDQNQPQLFSTEELEALFYYTLD